MLPKFKLYYKATVIQNSIVLMLKTDAQINRIKSSEVNPLIWSINLQQKSQGYTIRKE